MLLRFLGHAGFLVECAADRILCDPWLSPFGAYAASWFPYPSNAHLDPDLLESATHLYISHWHRDHFDEWFLRGRSAQFKREVVVLLPKFQYPKLKEWVEACGYSNVIEVKEEYRTESGTRIYIQTDENPLYSDSSIVIEHGGNVFVNSNDCKLTIGQEEEIVRRFGHVDVYAAQFSGATFHPTCYEYPEERKIEISSQRRVAKFERIVNSMERLRARVYIPSAGPACFLSEELFDLNLNSATVFSTADDFRTWLKAVSNRTWSFSELRPGEAIAADGAHHADRAPHQETRSELRERALQSASRIHEELERYASQEDRLVEKAKGFFRNLLDNVPELAKKANVTVRFTIAGVGSFFVDTFRGEIYDASRAMVLNQRYDIELASFWVAALVEKKINWEDLILSFRFRISRKPDVYNEAFIAFLQLESEAERRDYLDHLEKLSRTNRERIRREYNGEILEYDRYCPHNCEDLTHAKIEDGALTCPRHFWRFSLEDGKGLNNPCTIDVVRISV